MEIFYYEQIVQFLDCVEQLRNSIVETVCNKFDYNTLVRLGIRKISNACSRSNIVIFCLYNKISLHFIKARSILAIT